MHYTGQIYRPPTEANTPLLEVTIGCSYNKCAFCSMYRKTEFRLAREEDIIADLQELAGGKERIRRLYLLNGDPFILSTEKLLHIAELVGQYLPDVRTLTCYCSIRDLSGKSLEELKQLHRAGYNDLYIGLETAYPPAVEMIDKGFTVEEAYAVLRRVQEAGFRWNALLMCGIAGKGKSRENVEATAKLLNAIKPKMVSLLTTAVTPGTPLAVLRDQGKFLEQTEREHLEEEIMLLEALDMDDDCYFFGTHPFNAIPVGGFFDDKAAMIATLRREMAELGDDILDCVLKRGAI